MEGALSLSAANPQCRRSAAVSWGERGRGWWLCELNTAFRSTQLFVRPSTAPSRTLAPRTTRIRGKHGSVCLFSRRDERLFSLESRAPRAAAETAGEGMKEHEERERGVFSLPLFTHDKVASSAMEKEKKEKRKV